MPKNYQIPDKLFLKLIDYFLLGETDQETFDDIASMIDAKCDSIIKRNYYSAQFDKSLSPEQQEEARQKYLDMIGMRESYRYKSNKRP